MAASPAKDPRRKPKVVPAAASDHPSTPAPYQKYHWYIFGGLAVVLVLGAVIVGSRQQDKAASPSRNTTAQNQPWTKPCSAP